MAPARPPARLALLMGLAPVIASCVGSAALLINAARRASGRVLQSVQSNVVLGMHGVRTERPTAW
eukprot:8620778-Lingulodinium_polyedra.AAC.1